MAWGSGTLREGSKGEDVRRLQDYLSDHGFSPGPIDGIYGSQTAAAVKAYQKANKLNPDGIVGPQTWGAITKPKSSTTPTAKKDAEKKTPSDVDDLRGEFPALSPYLDIPEFQPWVKKLISGEWTEDRFLAAVKGSNWWKNRTLTQQQWVTLPQAEKDQRISERASQMASYYLQLYGAEYLRKNLPQKLDPNSRESKAVAEKIASGQMTFEQWQFQALTSALKNPQSIAAIDAKESLDSARRNAQRPYEIADELYTTARQRYWVPLTKDQALVWANKINSGTVAESDFVDYLRQQSASLYPLVAKQVMNGAEPGTLFAPYTNIAADELGIAPEAVVMDDRIFHGFFEQATQQGAFPSSVEFRNRIRALDEWRFSEKANDLGSDGALSIIRTFGRIA